MTKPRRAAFEAVGPARAADRIFEQLAGAILRGELPPGEPLPPERVLSAEFDISPVVLRRAIHRLGEVGLVRVRQGAPTLVQDISTTGDIRLIGLYYTLAGDSPVAQTIRRDAIEKQFLQGFAIVSVFGRRATADAKRNIGTITDTFDAESATEGDFAAFEETFWRALAQGGQNRIYQMEVVWWYGTLADARPDVAPTSTISDRIAFYRELARRLANDEDASAYYLAVIQPQLDALFSSSS